MSLLANSNAIEDAGYKIQRSLRFRSSASAYLNRTAATTTNQKTSTFSFWVKRGKLGVSQGIISLGCSTTGGASDSSFYVLFRDTDTLQVSNQVNNSSVWNLITTQVFRDPSAWYHIVVIVDTTQATSTNRVKLYLNGSQITSFSTSSYPSLNYDNRFNLGSLPNLFGSWEDGSAYYAGFDGYLAEVNFIDGQALTPSSFGQTDAITGVWTPKKYTGTYGTNGFYLPFSDNTSATTLAYDKSGNSNNWTPNNISTTAGATYDSMTDVPTLTSATASNFCVLNPLDTSGSGALTDGNLTVGSAVIRSSTFSVTSGKWYAECTAGSGVGSTNTARFGVNKTGVATNTFIRSDNICYIDNVSQGAASGGGTWTTGDIIGLSIDADSSILTWYKNGTQIKQVTTSSSSAGWTVFFGNDASAVTYANFGQRPFSYTPPTGFKALNTFNLPDPVIKKPNQYMDATTWTGDGTSGRAITNAGSFQPDLVWMKVRGQSGNHGLFDAVRGTGNRLISNYTDAETGTSSNWLSSFNSNGFTINNYNADYNVSGIATVGWQWKKGATPGFDIVTYTGNGGTQSISHSLGVAPKMIIVKSRSRSDVGWPVYHINDSATPNNGYMLLNSTSNFTADSQVWNNTAPTSSVFTVGNLAASNASGATYVAYLFAEIPGFSKFGSYTGNGSADGPFVFTNFQPKYVMIKRTDSTGDWRVIDTSRSPYNQITSVLQPDLSAAEATENGYDILSNGFKLRGTVSGINASGGTFVYAAFASYPFKNSNAF